MKIIATVWMFLVFGVSPQPVDNFPTLEECNTFRAAVQTMMDQFGVGQVSECISRPIVIGVTR